MTTIALQSCYLEQARQYRLEVSPGDAADSPFVATAAEFTHTVGIGDTPEEARQELLHLIAATLQVLAADGLPCPEPVETA